MAVLLEALLAGVSSTLGPRLERALNRDLSEHEGLDDDLVALIVKPRQDGLHLSAVWRSAERADTFRDSVLLPGLESMGLPAPVETRFTAVHVA